MGNSLLQRGLLLYVLTPESGDPYMIFYNYYKFCLFVSTDHMIVTFATDGHRAARYILAVAIEAL